jgi:glycosyltransferase involved in cell wall biosynthesis
MRVVSRVLVLMPAYNAGATIEAVFARIPAEAKARIDTYAVVNDGSRDDTDRALGRLSLAYPNLVVLRHERNQGYGAAIKTLLSYARQYDADVAIVLHADGQYSPEKIPELLQPFDEDTADVVQGSRMLGQGALSGGMPLYKFVANKCLTALENWTFGMHLAEYHSGYMLYSRRALVTLPFDRLSDSFDIDLELLVMAKVKGLRISEIAIPTIYAGEVSRLRPIAYGLRVLSVVWAYRRGKYR